MSKAATSKRFRSIRGVILISIRAMATLTCLNHSARTASPAAAAKTRISTAALPDTASLETGIPSRSPARPHAGDVKLQRDAAMGAARGFTLLEIAVVIFIMGLVMTLAIPYIGGFHNSQLKSEARRLAGRAGYLYDEASIEKVIYRVTFDLDHNGYYVSRMDPYSAQPHFAPYGGTWGYQVWMPAGVKLRDVSVEGIGSAKVGVISCQ